MIDILTSRQKKFAHMLMKQKGIVKTREYAERLGISIRSTYSDLNSIEEYLLINGFKVEKRPGIGLEIVRVHALPDAQKSRDAGVVRSPVERQFDIYYRLLFKEEVVTFQQLSADYLVSHSSVKNDIRLIKRRFLRAQITVSILSDQLGTRLSGSEEQWQHSMHLFNEEFLREWSDRKNPDYPMTSLKQFYPVNIIREANAIIQEFECYKIEILAEHYKQSILNVLIVLAYRAEQGHHIAMDHQGLIMNEILEMPYYLIAKDIIMQFTAILNITFSDHDILFLTKNLIANRIGFKSSKGADGEYSYVIERIIQKTSTLLEVDMTHDQVLKEQIIKHFPSMIYRLQNNIYIQNPLLEQIKEEYRLLFDLLWFVVEGESDTLQVRFNEDEISFLIIYFQIAVEKQQQIKRVIIVCPTGISTSQLVVNRIRSILPPLDIVEVASIAKLLANDLEPIDFIISTVPIKDVGKPVIEVSPLMSEDDVRNISEFYNTRFILRNDDRESTVCPHLLRVLRPDLIYRLEERCTKEEVISFMTDQLVAQGIVSDNYQATMLSREDIGGTDMISGAAIPHGNMKEVKQTCVTMVLAKYPIKWNNYPVRVIIFLNLEQSDMYKAKDILQDIFKCVKTKATVEQMSSTTSNEELLRLLGGQ